MIEISEKCKVKSEKLKMLLQVHDELVFEIFDDDLLVGTVKKIKEIMENIVKLKIELIVNVSQGENWSQQKELKV